MTGAVAGGPRATGAGPITTARARSQGLAGPSDLDVAGVVRRLGALQAQDYGQLLWALGSRIPGSTVADMEAQLASRAVVRTWSLRGTIHLLPADDAEWMRRLYADRLLARTTPKSWRYHAATPQMADRAADVLTRALRGGRRVRRDRAIRLLGAAGIPDDRQQCYFLFIHLALRGLIAVGPNDDGKQTLVLPDDWAPDPRVLDRAEALAELARRFFTSHGPASVHDLAYWAGLPVQDARAGLEAVRTDLHARTYGGATLWGPPPSRARVGARLIAAYDELHIGLTDRSAHFARHGEIAIATYNGMFHPPATIDGQIVGLWRRDVRARHLAVTLRLLPGVDPAAFEPAVARLAEFYGRPTRIIIGPPPERAVPPAPWRHASV